MLKCDKKVIGCVVAVVLLTQVLGTTVKAVTVSSPNKVVTVNFQLREGVPYWSLGFQGIEYLRSGRLGVEVDQRPMSALTTVSTTTESHQNTVKTVWGRFAEYDDRYTELIWTLRETDQAARTLRIVGRVYDQGLALRYAFPRAGGWGDMVRLTGALTEFNFAGDYTGWACL